MQDFFGFGCHRQSKDRAFSVFVSAFARLFGPIRTSRQVLCVRWKVGVRVNFILSPSKMVYSTAKLFLAS